MTADPTPPRRGRAPLSSWGPPGLLVGVLILVGVLVASALGWGDATVRDALFDGAALVTMLSLSLCLLGLLPPESARK